MRKSLKRGFDDPNDAPQADHIQAFQCDHCIHPHVALMDENDRFLAIAVMTVEMLEGLLALAKGPPTDVGLQ